MLRRVLPALLVGIATLGGATEAGAMPAAAASVTIESSTILVGGKRGWSKSWSKGSWSKSSWSRSSWSRGGWSRGGWSRGGWSRSSWSRDGFHRKAMAGHKRFHGSRQHRPGFVAKRFKAPVVLVQRAPVLLVRPAWGWSPGYAVRTRPLTRGSFGGRSSW